MKNILKFNEVMIYKVHSKKWILLIPGTKYAYVAEHKTKRSAKDHLTFTIKRIAEKDKI